jgi:3-deoxy-D-manno-octulosonic acid (KDO) 8-phosphate synthase
MTITGKLTELFEIYDSLKELKGWYKAAADTANPMSSLQYRAEGMSRGIAEAVEKLAPVIKKLETAVNEITMDMLPEAV